jgi:hypothetical protein
MQLAFFNMTRSSSSQPSTVPIYNTAPQLTGGEFGIEYLRVSHDAAHKGHPSASKPTTSIAPFDMREQGFLNPPNMDG